MVRKVTAAKTSLAAQVEPEEPKQVRRVTTREFRAGLRAIIDAGEPVIVTCGRRNAGVFFPAKFDTWWSDSESKAVIAKIKRMFPNTLRDLENY
jgi:hypothetical protein